MTNDSPVLAAKSSTGAAKNITPASNLQSKYNPARVFVFVVIRNDLILK